MHVAKCLMTVERVELHKLHEVVRFECEYDANNPGDRAFASGTPVGHFLVELTNSELASQFKPGDRYYLELSRQVEPEPMTVSAPASIDVSMNPYNDAKWVPCVSIGQLLQPGFVDIANRAAALHADGKAPDFLVVFKGARASQAYRRSGDTWRAAAFAEWKDGGEKAAS